VLFAFGDHALQNGLWLWGGTYTPPPVGPTNLSISINHGDAETVSRIVNLSLGADNATEMLISNYPGFFGAGSWIPYTSNISWTLTPYLGEKEVYVKFRDSDYNVSSVVSDTIILKKAAAEKVPSAEELPGISLKEKDLVKYPGSNAVYQIWEGKRHVFPHSMVYHSWKYPKDFSTVKTISQKDLEKYPIGDPVRLRDGSLFRGTTKSVHGKNASAVFYVSNGKLRPIKSAKIYQALFNDPTWDLVMWAPDDLLSKFAYPLGAMIDSIEGFLNVKVEAFKLRVRSLPGLSGKIISLVSKGQVFSAVDEQNGWYKIKYQSAGITKTGWVSGRYVRRIINVK